MATVTTMKGAGKFSQGLLLQFDKRGNARLTRMDFYHKAVIGEPWELGAPRKDRSHLDRYRHEILKARNTPPTLSSAEYRDLDAQSMSQRLADETARGKGIFMIDASHDFIKDGNNQKQIYFRRNY